MNFVNKNQ